MSEQKTILSDNAVAALRERYLRKDEDRRVIETPQQMFRRLLQRHRASCRPLIQT